MSGYVQVVADAPAMEDSPDRAMAMAEQVADACGGGPSDVLAAKFEPADGGGVLTLSMRVPEPYPTITEPPMCTTRPKVMHVYDLGAPRCRCGRMEQIR